MSPVQVWVLFSMLVILNQALTFVPKISPRKDDDGLQIGVNNTSPKAKNQESLFKIKNRPQIGVDIFRIRDSNNFNNLSGKYRNKYDWTRIAVKVKGHQHHQLNHTNEDKKLQGHKQKNRPQIDIQIFRIRERKNVNKPSGKYENKYDQTRIAVKVNVKGHKHKHTHTSTSTPTKTKNYKHTSTSTPMKTKDYTDTITNSFTET